MITRAKSLRAALAGAAAWPPRAAPRVRIFERPDPAGRRRRTRAEPSALETRRGADEPVQRLAGGALDPRAQWWTRSSRRRSISWSTGAGGQPDRSPRPQRRWSRRRSSPGAQGRHALPQVGLRRGIGRQKYGAQFLGSLAQAAAVHLLRGRPDGQLRARLHRRHRRGVEQQRALADYRGTSWLPRTSPSAATPSSRRSRSPRSRPRSPPSRSSSNGIAKPEARAAGVRGRFGLAARHRQRAEPARQRHDAAAAAARSARRCRARARRDPRRPPPGDGGAARVRPAAHHAARRAAA